MSNTPKGDNPQNIGRPIFGNQADLSDVANFCFIPEQGVLGYRVMQRGPTPIVGKNGQLDLLRESIARQRERGMGVAAVDGATQE
jgi:hypothetical protein